MFTENQVIDEAGINGGVHLKIEAGKPGATSPLGESDGYHPANRRPLTEAWFRQFPGCLLRCAPVSCAYLTDMLTNARGSTG